MAATLPPEWGDDLFGLLLHLQESPYDVAMKDEDEEGRIAEREWVRQSWEYVRARYEALVRVWLRLMRWIGGECDECVSERVEVSGRVERVREVA